MKHDDYDGQTGTPGHAQASTTVTVKSLKYHTADGEEHQEGDTYEVDASKVDNLVANGMAAPVE